MNTALVVFTATTVVSALTLFTLLKSSLASSILDHPNRANAMHVVPTPRMGGLAIVIAVAAMVVVSALSISFRSLLPALLGALVLAIVSFVDDRVGLGALVRLAMQIAVATAVCVWWYQMQQLEISSQNLVQRPVSWLNFLAISGVILSITWATNLFNFMDGADGLAGGMAFFGFGAYMIAASQFMPNSPNADSMTTLCASISGAALGFLFFNFSPAKVFMGDAGSIPLGFLAAVLGIHGVSVSLWQWWFPLLVFSPFIIDATTTLIKRIVRREKIWIAHRQHYYHQLILSGWNHRRVALSYYGVMIACAGSALVARDLAFPAPLLAFWVVTYVTLIIFLERHFKSIFESKDSGK